MVEENTWEDFDIFPDDEKPIDDKKEILDKNGVNIFTKKSSEKTVCP